MSRAAVSLLVAAALVCGPTAAAQDDEGREESAEDAAPPDRPPDPGWLIGAGATTGFAALTGLAALIAWSYREGHVERFNSDECVSATMTREDLCYDSAYVPGRQMEVTTAVLGGIAGAAGIAAIVLFLLTPSQAPDDDDEAWGCSAGPGEIGVACGARF